MHWSLDDAPYLVFNPAVSQTSVTASPGHVYNIWAPAFDELYERGRAFTLTMHPWIIGRAGRVKMLERLTGHMREHPHVSFERVIDVARSYAKRESLE